MITYRKAVRRLSVSLGFIGILAAGVNSQTKTSKEIDGLIGPVHKVVTVHITFVKTGDSWVEDKTTTGPVMTYDENGNDGRFGNGAGSELGMGGGTLKYDEKGRVIERQFYSGDNELIGKICFSYDDAGRLAEISEQDGQGRQRRRHTQTFDDKGNMTSLSTFDGDNKLTRKLTWTFDSNGNRTEWTESLLRGSEMALFEKITYSYDERGNVLIQTQYGNPEGTIMKQIFSYEFDARGNWIKRERLIVAADSSEAHARDVDLRSITYYESERK